MQIQLYLPADDRPPLKGLGHSHVTSFKYWWPQSYLWNG